MRRFMLIMSVAVVATFSMPTSSNAATLGCLLGAAGGGFGGAQIGKGTGKLVAVGIGTLLGCGIGSSIQDSDQARYQQQYQPQYQPQPVYQTPVNYARRNHYSRRQQYTGYVVHQYQPRPVYQQPQPQIVWQEAPKPAVKSCPYSREYQSTVMVGGNQVPAYGQACSHDGGQNWDLGPLTRVQ